VALELPVILAIAWVACRWIARRLAIPSESGPRLVMGVAALIVVLAADVALGLFLMGQPVDALAARYRTAAGLAGLGGQVLFAAIPILEGKIGTRP
jgi:hypothetical protein